MPMQKMMGGDSGDMDSLYASGESEGTPKEGAAETVDQEEAENDATALVPMKILQGKHPDPVKVGDEVVLKVTAVHGDEAEVAYSETKPGSIGKGEGPSAEAEIDSMDKENPGTY
jgi:hypothetical protein